MIAYSLFFSNKIVKTVSEVCMKILKKIIALCLVFCLGLGLGCLSEYPFTENSSFEAFPAMPFPSIILWLILLPVEFPPRIFPLVL